MRNTKQISVSKTKGEWSLIEKKVIASGKQNLNNYIRFEAIKIQNAFNKNPCLITNADGGKRIEKRPYIPLIVYQDLEAIAKKMEVPVSTVVDRLIIEPMLIPKP